MLRLFGTDWDAFAAILGHEYAHLALGHSGARQEREQVRQGVAGVLGFVLGAAGVPMGGTIADVATTAVERVYTRDEERDADRLGLEYAKRAGYDPQGAIRAWQQMMSVSNFSIPFLSTHPTSQERIDNLRTQVATLPPSVQPKPEQGFPATPVEATTSAQPSEEQMSHVTVYRDRLTLAGERAGFRFEDRFTEKAVVVTEVLNSRWQLQEGDLIVWIHCGPIRPGCARSKAEAVVSSSMLMGAIENAASDEKDKSITFLIRRSQQELWRSVIVR